MHLFMKDQLLFQIQALPLSFFQVVTFFFEIVSSIQDGRVWLPNHDGWLYCNHLISSDINGIAVRPEMMSGD